jgi:hypothetical protein
VANARVTGPKVVPIPYGTSGSKRSGGFIRCGLGKTNLLDSAPASHWQVRQELRVQFRILNQGEIHVRFNRVRADNDDRDSMAKALAGSGAQITLVASIVPPLWPRDALVKGSCFFHGGDQKCEHLGCGVFPKPTLRPYRHTSAIFSGLAARVKSDLHHPDSRNVQARVPQRVYLQIS